MDHIKLQLSLPHPNKMGGPGDVGPVTRWNLLHGAQWSPDELLAAADQIEADARRRDGPDWGDTRARYDGLATADFLRRSVALRASCV